MLPIAGQVVKRWLKPVGGAARQLLTKSTAPSSEMLASLLWPMRDCVFLLGRNKWTEGTSTPGMARRYMSADLKRVQQCQRTRRGIFFNREGFLVSDRLMVEAVGSTGTAILALVSSAVIQLTQMFPFYCVMSGVHATRPLPCVFPSSSGAGPVIAQKGELLLVNMAHNTKFCGVMRAIMALCHGAVSTTRPCGLEEGICDVACFLSGVLNSWRRHDPGWA